jgi:tetratricopeptide (TPR) repeat protein
MKKLLLFSLTLFFVATPVLLSQTSVSALPPIPEEARRHFVIGTTLFKDAKTTEDFAMVQSEFKQASNLAPQWPDARYNLALAKEAAGDYSAAMADLKLYQQFKLSESEARTVQDKIYALEAKEQKQVSSDTAKDAADAEEAKYGWLLGVWSYVSVYTKEGPPCNKSGIAHAKKMGAAVEIGSLSNYGHPDDVLRAVFSASGNISWEFHIADNFGCPLTNPLPVTPTISRDRSSIEFEVPHRSGESCQYSYPLVITLSRK